MKKSLHIHTTKSDFENLSLLKSDLQAEDEERFDYLNFLVLKPWGYEYLMFENEYAAIWFLKLNKGQKTSMHCHPQKKTCLMVLEGQIVCSTLESSYRLKSMDSVVLHKGVFHQSEALHDSVLIEVESPPNKTDLVRLRDNYGREKKGYEKQSSYRPISEVGNAIQFENDSLKHKEKIQKSHNGIDFTFFIGKTNEVIQKEKNTAVLYLGGNENIAMPPGEFIESRKEALLGNSILLSIKNNTYIT